MRLIDTFPTKKIGNLKYRVGRVFPFGATIIDGGVNFSVYSREARGATLVLYHHSQEEPFVEIPFPEEFRIGDVYTMMVFGLDFETTEYGYRFDGEFDPARGLTFDRTKVLLDPYAKSVTGRSVWGRKSGSASGFVHRGQIIRQDYDWEGDRPLGKPFQDLVIYEMHTRAFTEDESSGVRHRGTYFGIVEKIPYLKELGVNCLELLPIFEFDEFENYREYEGRPLYNFWGYSTVCFFAPKAGYAASAPFGMEADELKNKFKTKKDAFIYTGFNAHWEAHEMELPIIPAGRKWHLAFDSFSGQSYTPGKEPVFQGDKLYLPARSSAVLIGQ